MKKRYVVLYFIGILFFLLFLLTQQIDLNFLFQVENYWLIIAGFSLVFVVYGLSAFRTKYLLHLLNEKVEWKFLYKLEYITKFVYNFVPSQFTAPIKALILSGKTKIARTKSISITSFEYAIDIGTVLLLSAVGVYFLFAGLPYLTIDKFLIFAGIFIIGLLIFFLIPLKVFYYFIEFGNKNSNKIFSKYFTMFFRTLLTIREVWTELLFNKHAYFLIPVILVIWGLSVLSYWLIFQGFGIYVPFGYILVIMASSSLLGTVSQIPSGLGVRDATMILMYSYINVSTEISLSVVLLDRIVILFFLAIGYYFFIKEGKTYIENAENKTMN